MLTNVVRNRDCDRCCENVDKTFILNIVIGVGCLLIYFLLDKVDESPESFAQVHSANTADDSAGAPEALFLLRNAGYRHYGQFLNLI